MKAPIPILDTETGMFREVSPLQPAKDAKPMVESESGKVRDVSPVQPAKVKLPMLESELEKVREVSPVQPRKAKLPMLEIESGKVMEVSPGQREKAPSTMVVVPGGIVTWPVSSGSIQHAYDPCAVCGLSCSCFCRLFSSFSKRIMVLLRLLYKASWSCMAVGWISNSAPIATANRDEKTKKERETIFLDYL